jgi:hypothetical protein
MIRRLSASLLTVIAMVSIVSVVCQAQMQSLMTRHVREVTVKGQAPFVGTFKGNYGFVFSGFTVPGQNPKTKEVPFAGNGVFTFDGAGNVSGVFNASENGQISLNNTYTAAYAVNPDCTGSVISTNGNANGSFVVVSGGAEVLVLDVDAGNTWTADMKKQ